MGAETGADKGEAERESCWRDCRSSPSDDLFRVAEALLLVGVTRWFGDDMVKVHEGSQFQVTKMCKRLRPAPCDGIFVFVTD